MRCFIQLLYPTPVGVSGAMLVSCQRRPDPNGRIGFTTATVATTTLCALNCSESLVVRRSQANEKFERTNNLRRDSPPDALRRAYARMGVQFFGEKAVRDWQVGAADLRRRWPGD